jgi:7,8-dihydropterin-6-yl-methyl-4-(beta-D-ribofuranosyl)aminobenzene 5'-phosphate synthase
VRATIVYDNEACRDDLVADWGFAAFLEIEGAPRILFDTGGSGAVLLGNMERLGLSPADVEEVFVSHAHFDHTGGLSAVLDANPGVRVYAPPSFRGVRRARELVHVPELRELWPGVWSTGELGGIEQSLVVRTGGGTAVVAGCAHPGLEAILAVAARVGRPRAAIGGFHGFENLDLLEGMDLICPTHCTQMKEEILARFPGRAVRGGVGAVLDL